MKSDFLIAITQLSAEKHLPKEVVFQAVEAALVSAYKKDNQIANQDISVKIEPNTGEVKVYALKTVVDKPTNSQTEISLAEAQKIKEGVPAGETIEVETTPYNAGRIAAQTAKQVVLQRLREAEHELLFEEYAAKQDDIVSGIVRRIEPKQITIDLGRTEAILAISEQVRMERYRVGQRLKVYLLEVYRTNKGPQVLVSRSHPNLLRRLFELEIPEIYNGKVEVKSIAREAGHRSKVAVAASQQGIDPVGCCVGLRGIRIQNIVNELNDERVDVVQWHPEPTTYVTNALSPAQVLEVEIDGGGKTASVVVPDRQLSLAIGKEGQNARLAAKLTGWKIDIKGASAAEAEKAERATQKAEEAKAEELKEAVAEATEVPYPEEVEPVSVVEETLPLEVLTEPEPLPERRQIRFAEDILISTPKPDTKVKKHKKRDAQQSEKKELTPTVKPKRRSKSHLPSPDEDEDEDYEYLKGPQGGK